MFGSSSPTDIPAKIRVGPRKLKGKAYIAEGGFSHVFSVKDTKTKEYFALKRMICKDQDQLAHAIEEVAVMKRLAPHENIVGLEGVEICHNEQGISTVDILMQNMKGGRLIDVMKARSKHFSMPELLETFMCIAKATQHLHSQNPPIAHRDLKIENVLLDENTGVYKVCDFGSCTQRVRLETDAEIATFTREIELNTTPSYRSPEMLDLHIGSEVGIEADIWALGCTLYKMAYFKDAFPDGAASIIRGAYTLPADPEYPAALHHLLGLCLKVQMSARPDIDMLIEHVDMIRSAVWTEPAKGPTCSPLLPPPLPMSPMAEAGAPMGRTAQEPEAVSPQPAAVFKPLEASQSRRRSTSLANLSDTSVKSQSSDAAAQPSRTPTARKCNSDESVLSQVQRQSVVDELNAIQAKLAAIAEQETKLKRQRKALEERLVQIYECNPKINVGSGSLVASVVSDAPQQVEVASFFNGEDENDSSIIDRGPRSRVSSEASDSTWPNVILTLDDVDVPEAVTTPTSTVNTVNRFAPVSGPQSCTEKVNPFRDSAGIRSAGHKRSASMVIRPRQQQSERKSPSPSEQTRRASVLEPPPPAKPRHKHGASIA